MLEQSSQYFIGLDVGTSEVRCIVGAVDPTSSEPKIAIVGHGRCDNSGMRKGLVVHLDEVAQAIHEAIIEAERMSGIRIENATINVNGAHVAGIDSRGVIAISTANREISIDDKIRVEEAATIVQMPPNREIIQVFPKNYQVDGHDSIKDPVGMRGVRLEADTHIVTVAVPNLRSLDAALNKANIYPLHHTVSGLAAAEAVLTRKQKEAGTLVLDIGASTTNLAVIEDGEVQHVSVIPLGGNNVTNDLAIGLKVDLEIAEEVKIQHAALAGEGKDGRRSVTMNRQNYVFEAEDINMIAEARIEEILDFVDKELKSINKSRKLPGGVVITGGSAKMTGIANFTKDKLELAARLGEVQHISGLSDEIAKDISCMTAIGLMQLDLLLADQAFSSKTGNRGPGASDKILSSLSDVWRKIRP
jgi:cell division protein FtsA